MLIDSLSMSIRNMKHMDIVENAALDAEKKAKNDSDYRTVVDEFSKTVDKLQKTVKIMDYTITSGTVQCLEDSLDKLNEIVTADVVDAEALSIARQQINRKLNPNLSREWKVFHQEKTKVSISKLDTLGNLAGSPDMIASIRTNISNGSEWAGLSLSDDGEHTRLSLLKAAIDKIDDLEENLNLSDEIKAFIMKVTSKKARVSDVSEAVIKWIKNENLDDKFVISYTCQDEEGGSRVWQ